MKKLATIIFIFFGTTLMAQNAYYDALAISQSLDAQNQFGPDQFYILGKYFDNSPEIAREISTNPFLKKYFNPEAKSLDRGAQTGNPKRNVSNYMKGVDVTQFANVLSDIMIEHAKDELTVAFFNRFQKFIEEHEEFKMLFPKTAANFNNLLFYKYSEMLPSLRTSFFEDLNQITYRIDDVLLLPKYRDLLNNFPEVSVTIASLRLIHDLETGNSNAAQLISEFAKLKQWETATSKGMKNMANSLRVAAIFSESLRSGANPISDNDAGLWITPKEIKEFVGNTDAFTIYLGLIYQQFKVNKIQFEVGDTAPKAFISLIDNNMATIEVMKNKVIDFIALADKVNANFRVVNRKTNLSEEITDDEIYNYITLSIDVIDYSFGIVQLFDKNIDSGNFLTIPRAANNLYKDIYSKEYNQAVVHAFDIFLELNRLIGHSANDDKIKKVNKDFFDYIEKARPYALFMANMVNAQSDAEIKAALDNLILPVGSSSVKKYSTYNLAFQSYLGARFTTGGTRPLQSSWNDSFGVSAPVGVSISHGLGKGGAVSLFVPLIDLGAIVDYKLSSDTTGEGETVQKDYKIELGQLFSPGAYLVYGLPWNIPLSLGFGGQYGPGLSKIDTTDGAIAENPYWRWSAFLSVDIPLFNLGNKSKTKKID
ncbi:hypothetical protein HYN59_01635 [Flavobacterium album]|uniref:Uncharacterized protein n=1 Tax=Flavobacterium album TaxID=2175091 RepID=A0A2S1QU50_9FLAO|nr:hypothetical protein [Flavobacterium album]AWH83896.1 hypothetical protein HYN59_01635 [Flavobacterium album]